jgi:hypothetical protein
MRQRYKYIIVLFRSYLYFNKIFIDPGGEISAN